MIVKVLWPSRNLHRIKYLDAENYKFCVLLFACHERALTGESRERTQVVGNV